MHLLLPFVLAGCTEVLLVKAQATTTSLWVPFASETTFTGQAVGTDSQGHTTYVIEEHAEAGLSDGGSSTVPFSATLVEGSDYASLTMSLQRTETPGQIDINLGVDGMFDKDGNVIASSGSITTTVASVGTFVPVVLTGSAAASSSTQSGASKPSQANVAINLNCDVNVGALFTLLSLIMVSLV